ncbi:hypothetical protein JCM8547_007580 [Rhodosporidiobolus lusitaniae]
MTTSTSQAPILALAITHAGRTLDLALPSSSPLAEVVERLANEFELSPTSLKLLVKGKKVALVDEERSVGEALSEALGDQAVAAATTASEGTAGPSTVKPIKALLVGTKRTSLEALQATDALREKKHAAFLHHQSRSSLSRPSSSRAGVHTFDSAGEADPDRYRFYHLEPFPETVPMLEKRKAMLDRLASDPAVKDVMKKHKFAVGVLTELHPLLQPTLLGLNTNAGQKISLRLLTDALDGCRLYLDVRRVLLHELAHNCFGDHDNNFRALNSQLNKEVSAFESSPHFEPWDPAAASSSRRDEQAHKLNEEEAERVWDKLRFGLEDEVEEKRDRMGRAAEERFRRAREGR